MTGQLPDVVRAEVIKLRTLPAVPLTGFGTVVVAVVLAAVFTAAQHPAPDAATAALATMPFLQVGFILLGALASAAEYAGGQIRTTLTATPNRALALAGKTGAYLVMAVVGSAATLGGGVAGAWITHTVLVGDQPPAETSPWQVAGAVSYLILIGLLGLAVAVALRSLIPTLVTMLTLVLIVSPLLAGFTEHARWLPDQAGGMLYLPDGDTLAAQLPQALPLLAWIIVVGALANLGFIARDA